MWVNDDMPDSYRSGMGTKIGRPGKKIENKRLDLMYAKVTLRKKYPLIIYKNYNIKL